MTFSVSQKTGGAGWNCLVLLVEQTEPYYLLLAGTRG